MWLGQAVGFVRHEQVEDLVVMLEEELGQVARLHHAEGLVVRLEWLLEWLECLTLVRLVWLGLLLQGCQPPFLPHS